LLLIFYDKSVIIFLGWNQVLYIMIGYYTIEKFNVDNKTWLETWSLTEEIYQFSSYQSYYTVL